MVLSVLLMLAAADLPPERPVSSGSPVRVHRDGKKPETKPKAPEKPASPDATAASVKVHTNKTPQDVTEKPAPKAIPEYDSDPVLSADIAFQRCIESEAETAALADVSFEEFKKRLPSLCADEETLLAHRFAESRAGGDPMKQTAGVPRSKSRALVFDYTDGLRQVAGANYINLVKSRTPMRLDANLQNRKPQ